MLKETTIGIAADPGGGPKVRNLEAAVAQDDGAGSVVKVEIQAVVLVDSTGKYVDFGEIVSLLSQILAKLCDLQKDADGLSDDV